MTRECSKKPAREHIEFEKIPNEGMVFKCSICGLLRMYGRANIVPENLNPILVCHGDHSTIDHKDYRFGNEHFAHTFVGIMRGNKIIMPIMEESIQ